MAKQVKLIMVTGDVNHNKFYDMVGDPDGTWTATWGRVGTTGQSQTYSGKWKNKYNEKIKGGYKDISDIAVVSNSLQENEEVEFDIPDCEPLVIELVKELQKYASALVSSNYNVKTGDVTAKQIEAAQAIIDQISLFYSDKIKEGKTSEADTVAVNKFLLELYSTIPRKMAHPKNHLIQNPTSDFEVFENSIIDIITKEQDLLSTLEGQVKTVNASEQHKKRNEINLSELGLEISMASQEDRLSILKNTDFKLTGKNKVYVINNIKTKKEFNANNVKLLYHGSRNENWWSILLSGLKIRPSNSVYTGSMFGDGIYGADKAIKSIGYTSLSGSRWASGKNSKAYLALFEFSLGKPWSILEGQRWQSWMSKVNKDKCRENGYDSVFAKGGTDLINNEYIVYDSSQVTIKYLIELNK